MYAACKPVSKFCKPPKSFNELGVESSDLKLEVYVNEDKVSDISTKIIEPDMIEPASSHIDAFLRSKITITETYKSRMYNPLVALSYIPLDN